ncbi:hypothetical protein AB9K34_03520 [Sedimentitalea sp. XS_ASV28]|uniref:hypothetical protein n=1 Tax=Sedimentitalea sp. XS_ASV28 TaxID=3241296 RepID=UPI0035116CEA
MVLTEFGVNLAIALGKFPGLKMPIKLIISQSKEEQIMSTLGYGTNWAAAAVLAVASTFAAGGPVQAQEGPVNLTVASFRQGSSWYVYAVNLAELFSKTFPEGSTVDSPPIAGGLGNPPLVAQSRADLAFGMAVVGNWALEGKHAFDELTCPPRNPSS